MRLLDGALVVIAMLIASEASCENTFDRRSLLGTQLDTPIECKGKENKRVAARTPRELFGDEWAQLYLQVTMDEATDLYQTHAPVLVPTRKMRKNHGTATVTAQVDAYGVVQAAYVICSTDAEFDSVFVESIKQARFNSPRADGVPIPTLMRQQFQY